jgi:hypothetical protein
MAFTNVFGGNTIYPSDVSYLALTLSADSPLEWPLESSGTEDPAARIIDVTPTDAGFSVILPDATQTGAGQTILFNNLSGAYRFFVEDFAGTTLATVSPGEQWQVYLAVTSTPAGTWRVFRYGASTATVQPSALAGPGLTVIGSQLAQATPVTSVSTTGLTLASSSRAGTFVWTGTGAGTINLPTAAAVGNNYFVLVRNAGGGDLTIDPSGTEVINDAASLAFRPGDSATLITDGAQWYTVGFGQDAVFAFDYTSISVTGGDYTLAGSELNRIAYKFVGTLTSDLYVIIPATVQQYWITNDTTGAFNFFVKVAGGTPTQVQQGAKGIYYCDGANVILASDPTSLTTPISVAQGGTGATTASAARLNLGITLFADPIVTATSGASVRSTIGAAASGANTDITALDQDVEVTATGTIAATTIGYRGVPQNAQSGAYAFGLPDAGKHIYSTNTGAQIITVPTNATTPIPVGTAISVVNNGTTAITFATTGTTVYKAGVSLAWASGGTLAVRGMANWLKVAANTWFVSGSGLS